MTYHILPREPTMIFHIAPILFGQPVCAVTDRSIKSITRLGDVGLNKASHIQIMTVIDLRFRNTIAPSHFTQRLQFITTQ